MNAKQVAAFLAGPGKIKVLSFTEGDMSQDGEVELENGYSVQVGKGYYALNRVEGKGEDFCMTHGKMHAIPKGVLDDCWAAGLKQA